MNKLFVDDLVEQLGSISSDVDVFEQNEVLEKLISCDMTEFFPMISFEETDDSPYSVGISESKFLNSSSHKGTWIVGYDDDKIDFILNLKNEGCDLYIDVFEINSDMRHQGIGSNVISILESLAEDYFDRIYVSPFDTNAMNFWEHMEYNWTKNEGNLVKELL